MDKVPGWVWFAAVIGIAFLMFRKTVDDATKKATSPAVAKNVGYGIGSGAVDQLGSAVGKFFGSWFGGGGSTTSKSSNDSGGPVTRSSGIDWDTSPPDDAVADDLAGPDFV